MSLDDVSLATATIQTDRLLQNIESFKQLLTADTLFMAVIKANAYSHGATPLARKMEAAGAADYFGVAQLKEALALREKNIKTPILVFNAVRPKDIKYAIKSNITMTVFSTTLAENIVAVAEDLNQEARVHLKIDTGMARLGVSNFDDALAVYQALASPFVQIEGIYTHFADAYEQTRENFTHEQFKRFKAILDQFAKQDIGFAIRHSCNTAATINFPAYHLDMVRVGLGLYGFDPTVDASENIALKPLETVRATVTHVKNFPAGESVGYNRNYYSENEMRIATVAIGYADGVAKALSNKGYFTYQGKKLPIVGDVCMDQVMLDSSEAPELEVGEEVTYFGDANQGDLALEEVAAQIEGSEYDLLCRIGSRVQRVYQ